MADHFQPVVQETLESLNLATWALAALAKAVRDVKQLQ